MAADDKDKELMKDVGRGPSCLGYVIRTTLLALVVLIVLLALFCLRKVEPWEVGLRYWNLPVPGVVKKGEVAVLKPGYNVVVPYLHQYNAYDERVQRFEMAPSYADAPAPDLPPLKVRTALDQDEIDVYVTILYHIKNEMATELRKHYSDNRDIRENGIKIRCPQILQARLGEIATAYDFYTKSKKGLVEAAKKDMNREFNERGVVITDVLIRDFKFKDEIEASIISKVIADERVEMEAAFKDAASARADWQKLVAEANAAAEAELAKGTAQTRTIDADAARYMTEKTAEGDKLILQAQAEGKGKISQALAGRGGRIYVGLEYAKALDGISLIVLPAGGPDGINPLDLEKTVMRLQPSASSSGGGQ